MLVPVCVSQRGGFGVWYVARCGAMWRCPHFESVEAATGAFRALMAHGCRRAVGVEALWDGTSSYQFFRATTLSACVLATQIAQRARGNQVGSLFCVMLVCARSSLALVYHVFAWHGRPVLMPAAASCCNVILLAVLLAERY